MAAKYAAGRRAIAVCDRCGFRYKLSELKKLTIKERDVNLLVCPECWEPDHPQLMVGKNPVVDAQNLREPRPDPAMQESRDINWGWNPVGKPNKLGLLGQVNNLVVASAVGGVTVMVGENDGQEPA